MWELLRGAEGEARTIGCGPRTGSDASAGKSSHWGANTTEARAAPADREWRLWGISPNKVCGGHGRSGLLGAGRAEPARPGDDELVRAGQPRGGG